MANNLFKLIAQRPVMGALPTLLAATGSEVQGGDYYGPEGLFELRGYPKEVNSNARSHDMAVAKRLWRISEELTGVEYAMVEGALEYRDQTGLVWVETQGLGEG